MDCDGSVALPNRGAGEKQQKHGEVRQGDSARELGQRP